MAYHGGIDYLEPDFGNYEWEDIESPWSRKASGTLEDGKGACSIVLIATARAFDLGAAVQTEGDLIFDIPDSRLPPQTMCVVLGKAKGSLSYEKERHCVLIIAPTIPEAKHGHVVYERLGAGFLPGKCLPPSSCKDRVHIH